MRLNRIYVVLAVALVGAGAGIALAGAAAPAAVAPAYHGHWAYRGSAMVGTLLRATRQLNLTADQQQSIRSLVSAARAQRRAAAGGGVDFTVLGNPGHPEYATAVQSAKTAAASRIEAEVALQGQIYDVLTTEQKQQLPQVLAAMKAKFQQRKSAWQQHAASGGTAGG